MSSRSLAAARARRSGENVPPVSGNRPGMSNGSNANFAPQAPPSQPTNVRISRSTPQSQPQNMYQTPPEAPQNKLPFNKLSVSDAIGLITLRLGRVEQWIIETDHENSTEVNENSQFQLPDNSRIVDNSIFTNIINRLDSLEKNISENGGSPVANEDFTKLSEDFTKLTEQFTRLGDETTKHTLTISKHSEQLLRFEREFVETKDILKTFMLKYDNFVKETTDKFTDYEFVIEEFEKKLQVNVEVIEEVNDETNHETNNESEIEPVISTAVVRDELEEQQQEVL
jgi:hypothetical protein